MNDDEQGPGPSDDGERLHELCRSTAEQLVDRLDLGACFLVIGREFDARNMGLAASSYLHPDLPLQAMALMAEGLRSLAEKVDARAKAMAVVVDGSPVGKVTH